MLLSVQEKASKFLLYNFTDRSIQNILVLVRVASSRVPITVLIKKVEPAVLANTRNGAMVLPQLLRLEIRPESPDPFPHHSLGISHRELLYVRYEQGVGDVLSHFVSLS